VAQSLFAEGSYNDQALRHLFKRATVILLVIMIPACILLALLGPFVLDFFGKAYGAGGSSVIILLAVSAPIIAAYNMGGVLLKITKQIYSMMFVNFMYAVIIVALAWLWVGQGLVWIAIAWIIGNLAAAVLALILVLYHHQRHLSMQKRSSQQAFL